MGESQTEGMLGQPYASFCYFIPSDLPQFKREKFQKGDTPQLKGGSPVTSLQYVFEGVKSLQKGRGDHPNVEIIIVFPLLSRVDYLVHASKRK